MPELGPEWKLTYQPSRWVRSVVSPDAEVGIFEPDEDPAKIAALTDALEASVAPEAEIWMTYEETMQLWERRDQGPPDG
jgi:hypothetical protein